VTTFGNSAIAKPFDPNASTRMNWRPPWCSNAEDFERKNGSEMPADQTENQLEIFCPFRLPNLS
jgi:hypothetical protein